MNTQEIIEDFFEERFNDTTPFFLYKDKQLLKNGEFKEYAKEQISKAKKIFWIIAWVVFICSWYGITSLIKYGAEPNWFDLMIGLISWIALIGFMVYWAKEYYTIKSSMEMFVKLIDRTEPESANH